MALFLRELQSRLLVVVEKATILQTSLEGNSR
jgi:hypothetical protein